MSKQSQPRSQSKSLLGSGSTLLNLACTGTTNGAFGKGDYVFLVGDSMSGKTWLSMTCLAEATQRKAYRKHTFIRDDPEAGAKMDIEYYFGKAVAERLEPPPSGGPSRTVQEFYFNIDKALDNGPCIYVLDSMDALDDDSDIEQFEKEKKAHETGKATTGSYGTGKAKTNSQGLRRLTGRLQETGSILIVISQTRDNIGFGAMFNPKTRAGGKALRFYAQLEIWTSVKETIKKKINDKQRQMGTVSKCVIKKNRNNGQLHEVEIPIFHSYGIDDVGSCIDFLIEEKHWKKNKAMINAHDFEVNLTRNKLIEHIESNDLEEVLKEVVKEQWDAIQESLRMPRKRRYE